VRGIQAAMPLPFIRLYCSGAGVVLTALRREFRDSGKASQPCPWALAKHMANSSKAASVDLIVKTPLRWEPGVELSSHRVQPAG
jgi:hypothetical protein